MQVELNVGCESAQLEEPFEKKMVKVVGEGLKGGVALLVPSV
jgi:hypothetical protein